MSLIVGTEVPTSETAISSGPSPNHAHDQILLLFRGRRLLWHRRSLRQHDLPISVLFRKYSQESIFPAERLALIRPMDRHVFGQNGHRAVGVKLNIRFRSLWHLECTVRPLQ